MSTYAWTVYATQTAIVLAVMGLLGTALFQLLGRVDRVSETLGDRIDRLADRMDARFEQLDRRFEQVDARFDRLENKMREHKDEVVVRIDGLADRITRLEARGGSAA